MSGTLSKATAPEYNTKSCVDSGPCISSRQGAAEPREETGSGFFIGGRGAQEKTIAELKGEFALDVVPTRHYGANCAWQQLSILAYNVARSFQLDTIATPRRRSRKRTYAYVLRSMRTLRFLLITRAGRLTRIGGCHVLRLAQSCRRYEFVCERC